MALSFSTLCQSTPPVGARIEESKLDLIQQMENVVKEGARESTSDNHASARQCVEWPRADLFGYIIQVESGVELREQSSKAPSTPTIATVIANSV
ncbi:hypothetical protein Syun_019541 [Stephania yunnanensis]|uniref:Uncharacterized protein n=1 Tax=Stephania yunnanensis TaxID=152371 RepID=A0AAP0IUF1_9MAGN